MVVMQFLDRLSSWRPLGRAPVEILAKIEDLIEKNYNIKLKLKEKTKVGNY